MYVCSAPLNIGLQPILDGMLSLLPSPLERRGGKAKVAGWKEESIKLALDGPFGALVFKTISDLYTGRNSQATHRIIEEDPTVRIERDPETSQLLISGNGQLHVEIIAEAIKEVRVRPEEE